MTSDLKTTVATLVQAIVAILAAFGVSVSPEDSNLIIGVAGAIIVAAQLLFGYFTNKK